MSIFIGDSGWACRENGAQEYSTGYAQDLDEIRALWMAMAQRREALTVRDCPCNVCSDHDSDLSFNLACLVPVTLTPASWTCCCLLLPYLLTTTWVMLILVCLQELRSTEEKLVRKLELDREKNSVIHLTQAKADCEGIASPHLYHFLLMTTKFEEQAEIIASLC
jgi:ferredoxin-thioredoxin reductase catalytic subunit